MKKLKTKICFYCKGRKPISQFYKNSVTNDGYGSYCKICNSKLGKIYKEKRKQKQIYDRPGRGKHRVAVSMKNQLLIEQRCKKFLMGFAEQWAYSPPSGYVSEWLDDFLASDFHYVCLSDENGTYIGSKTIAKRLKTSVNVANIFDRKYHKNVKKNIKNRKL